MLAVAPGLARSDCAYWKDDKIIKAVQDLDLDGKMAILRRLLRFNAFVVGWGVGGCGRG